MIKTSLFMLSDAHLFSCSQQQKLCHPPSSGLYCLSVWMIRWCLAGVSSPFVSLLASTAFPDPRAQIITLTAPHHISCLSFYFESIITLQSHFFANCSLLTHMWTLSSDHRMRLYSSERSFYCMCYCVTKTSLYFDINKIAFIHYSLKQIVTNYDMFLHSCLVFFVKNKMKCVSWMEKLCPQTFLACECTTREETQITLWV